MSLLSRNIMLNRHLYVSLSKNSVAIIYRGGFKNKIISEKHLVCPSQGSFDWMGLITQLDQAIVQLMIPSKTKLSVTLSSDMVRYLTLPSQHVALSQAEKNVYAQAAYKEIYGFVIANWLIKCHDAPPNQPMLTSAIDFALFDELQNLAIKHELIIHSIQPYLMSVFNALHPSLKRADAILAIVEPNRLLLVNIQQGYCHQVRTFHHTGKWQELLMQIIARETLMGDINVRNLMVYAPQNDDVTQMQLDNNWLFKKLELKKNKFKNKQLTQDFAMLEAFA